MAESATEISELLRVYRASIKAPGPDPAMPGTLLYASKLYASNVQPAPQPRSRSWADYSYLIGPLLLPVVIPALSGTVFDTIALYLGAGFFIVIIVVILARPVSKLLFPLYAAADRAEATRQVDERVIRRLRESASPASLSRAATAMKATVATSKRRAELLSGMTVVTTAAVAFWLYHTGLTEPVSWHYVSLIIPVVTGVATYHVRRTDNHTAHFVYCLEEAAKIEMMSTPRYGNIGLGHIPITIIPQRAPPDRR